MHFKDYSMSSDNNYVSHSNMGCSNLNIKDFILKKSIKYKSCFSVYILQGIQKIMSEQKVEQYEHDLHKCCKFETQYYNKTRTWTTTIILITRLYEMFPVLYLRFQSYNTLNLEKSQENVNTMSD